MADYEDKEQKTEEATPRRLEEARERGQVALSTELVAGVGLAVGLGALLLAGGRLARAVGTLVAQTLDTVGDVGRTELTAQDAAEILKSALTSPVGALGLFVAPAVVGAILVGYGQVGVRISPRALELDPSKLDPVKGMRRVWSLRAVVRTALAAVKVLAIAGVMGTIAWQHVPQLGRVATSEPGPLLAGLGRVALRCTIGALVVILLIGIFDLLYQRWQHGRDLRMSKQEVKDELKTTEGDPHVKARVRSLQREMATRRMMDDVPRATVVVTNPTHYAVALRYEQDELAPHRSSAPRVVAKGVDHLARRIKERARAASVVCWEDVPLARALYAQVEVGHEIPEELYAAVATVLSHVYRLRGRAAARAGA